MNNNNSKSNPSSSNGKGKINKSRDAKKLFKAFYDYPKSRRMGATEIGYEDQTYMVTQLVSDWLKTGKAEVCGEENLWKQ
jgi:hypothetical protein